MVECYRLTTLEDAEELRDLVLRAYAPVRELGINFAAATADLSLVQSHIINNLCYVLEEEGEMVATISLRMPWGLQPGPLGFPHIGWFAVDPDIGKSGVGSKLLTWLEEEVLHNTMKTPAVTLGTADKHPWLAQMYEKRGYKKISEKNLGRGHITFYFEKVIRQDLYDALQK